MRIQKTRDVKTPNRGTNFSAGIDFYIPNDIGWESKFINSGESIKIPSGIKADIPEGYMLCAFNKSGVSLSGLQVGACVCDEDYQGEINLHLFNASTESVVIKSGQKIVQFILIPVLYADVEEVDGDLFEYETSRGKGGFGSTGLN